MSPITIIYIILTILSSHQIKSDANLRIAFLPFANLTNQFLSTIQPNNGLNVTMQYISQLFGNNVPSTNAQDFVNNLWYTYLGYIILIIIGLLFIILFSIVGLCFGLCRCCCKRCGAKPPGSSSVNTKRKRLIFNIFLFLLTIMILIGSIVSMASNVVLLDALKIPDNTTDTPGNVFSNIDTTVAYANSYINYIANNGINKGTTILQNTFQNILSILSNVITLFANTFLNTLNFGTILNTTDIIINGYSNLVIQSQNLSTTASLHQNMTQTFTQYLQMVVQNISANLNSGACQNFTGNCVDVNTSLPYLILGYNDSKINYTLDIGSSNIANGFNVSDLINARANVFNNSANAISQLNTTLSGYITDFSNSVSTNSSIYQSFNNTFNVKNTAINFINSTRNSIYAWTPDGQTTVQNNVIYSYYRWAFYGFIVLIGIILIIVLLFFVGLCFGLCGGPNFEDSSCCSKGAGSGFFMGSTAISFLFGWLIMLIVMIMFLIGGLVQTEVCRYISPPYDPTRLMILDQFVNNTLTKLNYTFTLFNSTISLPNVNFTQSLLNNCSSSVDIISAFKIPTTYINSLSNIIFQQFFSPYLVTLVQKVQNYNLSAIDVSALSNKTGRMLTIFNALNVNSTSTITELQKPVTRVTDVEAFVALVNNLAQIANSTNPTFSANLMSAVSQLNQAVYDMNNVHQSYLQQKMSFVTLVSDLSSSLTTLINYISILPSKTSDAKTAAFTIANSTLFQNTNTLVNETVFNVLKSLGNCQGLAATVTSAIGIVCTTVLVPFNNLWMGMGWFLLFIIPAIIVALKLHRLYRITHIESNTSSHNKAYQSSNNFLSVADMELIRMERPRRI